MSRSPYADALAHHVWANGVILDACLALDPALWDVSVPGTYGSILATARHLAGAEAFYLFTMGLEVTQLDESALSLADARRTLDELGRHWDEVVARHHDPTALVAERELGGYWREAPVSLRLAQALHHGSDHRSQLCTMLSTFATTPPEIDVWAYGAHTGEIREGFVTPE